MDATYYQTIANSTAHRKSRDDNKDFIFNHPDYLPYLLQISYNTKDKNHHKACWILELIFEEQLELILPHLTDFCNNLKHYTSDSAIRSLSKICLFLAQSKTIKLTETQEEQIIEACLDWLIQTDKAANAAYNKGQGLWPTMKVVDRIKCMENFVKQMNDDQDRNRKGLFRFN